MVVGENKCELLLKVVLVEGDCKNALFPSWDIFDEVFLVGSINYCIGLGDRSCFVFFEKMKVKYILTNSVTVNTRFWIPNFPLDTTTSTWDNRQILMAFEPRRDMKVDKGMPGSSFHIITSLPHLKYSYFLLCKSSCFFPRKCLEF